MSKRRGPRAVSWRVLLGMLGSLALLLGACGSGTTPSSSSTKPVQGGTVTYAYGQNVFKWIFPLPNEVSWTQYEQGVSFSLWPPLYTAGSGALPIVDEATSLAYPPVFSSNDSVVTVKLKPGLKWSDGQPVTTADVKFFFELFDANKTSIASYVPGDFPDNVASVSYPTASEFVIHLTGSYSQQWVSDNELTEIIPLPRQEWDRTSLSGPAGNAASTPAGARAVFGFLTKQSETLSTYVTNPLWKVIDGAWGLTSFDPTTSRVVLTANARYSGPAKPRLHQVIILSYQSDTAEVDALRGGALDYGFVPYSDYLGLKGYLRSSGYTISPWMADFVQWGELNYSGPDAALTAQLYIRQALQHVIDQQLYIQTTLHGIGVQTYGPVPNTPGSQFVSPQEKTDPYPYSIPAATGLLTSNGWAAGSGGTMVCQHPGTATGECGAGISGGRKLSFLLMYQTGSPTLAAQVEAFQTAAAKAGINIALDPQTLTTMYSLGGVCPKAGPCDWGIKLFPNWLWDYGDTDVEPTGAASWATGNYWGGGYNSTEADALITATHKDSGLSHLYTYENYISRQVAALWFPTWANQISVVKNSLHGWQPQQAFGFPEWSAWYYG
ncbi:MAG: ABC transporter substrate-binding protein [Acidimicrobiales bacterium]